MRIVIDTNIWVSGLLWRGAPWEVLRLAEAGRFEICMAPKMLVEWDRVMAHERLSPRLAQLGLEPVDLVAFAMKLARIYEVPEEGPAISADPDDDIFLRCAVITHASYVVSGDHHLLDLGIYEHIPIVTARDLITRELGQ